MKIHAFWFVALLATGMADNAIAADDWKLYRYPGEGFALEFPGAPKLSDKKVDPEIMVRGRRYMAANATVTAVFSATAALFHHGPRVSVPETSCYEVGSIASRMTASAPFAVSVRSRFRADLPAR